MDDVAEKHPKNVLNILGDDKLYSESYEEVASGIPTDLKLLDMSERAPYMLKVKELAPSIMKSYCPIWKEINDAAVTKDPKSLHQWLKKKDIAINNWSAHKSATDVKEATHVTMNNGRFFVDWKNEPEFLKWYAVAITLNKQVWFVEQLTPVLRFFVDLDFVQMGELPERHMEASAHVVQKTVGKFYDLNAKEGMCLVTDHNGQEINVNAKEALKAVVCTTNYKYINAKEGKPEMVKTGVHILWPFLFVSRDDALDIRESLLVALEMAFGKRVHPNNSWQDVVDASVYGSGNAGTKGSGLRMLGSRKTDTCANCKGCGKIKSGIQGEKKTCPECAGHRRLDSGRPYFPLCVLDSFGLRDHAQEEMYRQDMHKLILHTKVRTNLDQRPLLPAYAVPIHAPRHLASLLKRKRASAADKDAQAGIVKIKDSKLQASTKKEISNSSDEWDLLQSLIRGCGDGVYSGITLSKVTTDSKFSQFVVHVSGEMCRFCHNIGREHNSNRIFFVVDASGIQQRCHDAAEEASEEMKFGLCRNYGGRMGDIPQPLVTRLFSKCPAAKSLGQGALLEPLDNENDEEENIEELGLRIQRDKKTRKLYEIGDQICQELYVIFVWLK